MLSNAPLTVDSRHRCYTSERHRRDIDTKDTPYGRRTPVTVGIVAVDRSPEWGTYSQSATFLTTLGYRGEIRLPAPVVEKLDIAVGDTLRVSVARRDTV